ncbi:maltooligosyl trehalose synthase [Thermodesulfitimonas autotrophica]|uniref:Maltooligosyl trehalose synthase n=1 Tax=Thermodesulfitimonas autotrophica TaxID=1894989 RepID=A0A3N5B136_9THEO|nr:malto-oligosyltrehalose synthase [Thermodesulfitimonas autotrophica]RPF49340.1 maltooligosyl trehalose synthase [Thermodesulfitimonas autotrophica]
MFKVAGGRVPGATYRIQLGPHFGFSEAAALIPYLAALGITDLYAAPILEARAGSTHGYDVTDPTRVRAALGGEEGFRRLVAALKAHGLGLLLDIVPNHMAASPQNPWWADLLRHGQASPYAPFFDIDWDPPAPDLRGRVLLPVLGAPFGEELEKGALQLALQEEGFYVCYHEQAFPLSPETAALILPPPEAELPEDAAALRRASREVINAQLRCLNGTPGNPESFNRLEAILAQQHYRLACWRLANSEINYRRFFDVSELVGVRVEDPAVFEATHRLLLRLAAEGSVTGFRIDHIDGLYDPYAYLHRLREKLVALGLENFYLVVEKIRTGDEELPGNWPVAGTTGYDFLNAVSELFVDERGLAHLEETYREATDSADFSEVVYRCKRLVLDRLFASETATLAQDLWLLARKDRYGWDLPLAALKEALIDLTASLPVYRTYVRGYPVAARDKRYIEEACAQALRRSPHLAVALTFLRRLLLLTDWPRLSPAQQEEHRHFVMRWQQLTGPVTAKGFEDTALYRYNRLLALNEVGGDPGTSGLAVSEFHARNAAVLRRWPHTLNATSTHDTKRSEDVRARLSVLSEIPAIWVEKFKLWQQWNRRKKPVVKGRPVPDANTEWFIYQTLLGAWPLDEKEEAEFKVRLAAYVTKAAREAKVRTEWLDPDPEYEQALSEFLTAILAPESGNLFRADFEALEETVAYYGALNSLAQALLKIATPGIPDFYQGTEVWNFSLVDPDNRRPVDFARHSALLQGLQKDEKSRSKLSLVQELLASWKDGRIKLYTIYKALHFRRDHLELFSGGAYLPLTVAGLRREHVCAFIRQKGNQWVVVAVPRLLVRLQQQSRTGLRNPEAPALPARQPPLGAATWNDDRLLLPESAPEEWYNIFTGESLRYVPSPHCGSTPEGGHTLYLADVFRSFPVALLTAD